MIDTINGAKTSAIIYSIAETASIDAEHDISMREVYGLDKALRE